MPLVGGKRKINWENTFKRSYIKSTAASKNSNNDKKWPLEVSVTQRILNIRTMGGGRALMQELQRRRGRRRVTFAAAAAAACGRIELQRLDTSVRTRTST